MILLPEIKWSHVATFVVCIVIAMLRLFVPSHHLSLPGTYEALAHIFVGWCLAGWWMQKDKFYLVYLAIPTAIETLVFTLWVLGV